MKTTKMLLFVIVISLLVTACGPSVKRIVVSPDNTSTNRGQTVKFEAIVVGRDSPPQNVTWAVTGGVEGTTISSEGVLTIGKMETAETLIVSATSIIDTKKSGKANVTVSNPIVFGPGGGIVFYDKGEYTDGWRYLEAAPASSEFVATWGLRGVELSNTSEKIGAGKANTTAIINRLNANGETGKAAQLCATLSINGLTDWFLPSKDELNEMYKYDRDVGRIGGYNIRGNYPQGYYLSSSVGGDTRYGTYAQRFSDGYQDGDGSDDDYGRNSELRVRGVRAF